MQKPDRGNLGHIHGHSMLIAYRCEYCAAEYQITAGCPADKRPRIHRKPTSALLQGQLWRLLAKQRRQAESAHTPNSESSQSFDLVGLIKKVGSYNQFKVLSACVSRAPKVQNGIA